MLSDGRCNWVVFQGNGPIHEYCNVTDARESTSNVPGLIEKDERLPFSPERMMSGSKGVAAVSGVECCQSSSSKCASVGALGMGLVAGPASCRWLPPYL